MLGVLREPCLVVFVGSSPDILSNATSLGATNLQLSTNTNTTHYASTSTILMNFEMSCWKLYTHCYCHAPIGFSGFY